MTLPSNGTRPVTGAEFEAAQAGFAAACDVMKALNVDPANLVVVAALIASSLSQIEGIALSKVLISICDAAKLVDKATRRQAAAEAAARCGHCPNNYPVPSGEQCAMCGRVKS